MVFELLKRHLCLEVSAIAIIDLDEYIRGSQIRCLMYIAAISLGPGRSL